MAMELSSHTPISSSPFKCISAEKLDALPLINTADTSNNDKSSNTNNCNSHDKNENSDSSSGSSSNISSNMHRRRDVQIRRVPVPPHRLSPLKREWITLIDPIVKHLKLAIRMNIKNKCVEIKQERTVAEGNYDCSGNIYLNKAYEYVKCYLLGFSIVDAVGLLRLDDLYIESFEIKDVKRLQHAHLSRSIGRISGKEGKTKFAIENSTRTRIVIADTRIHILGTFASIKLARDAICSLILGTPPGKVYNHLKVVSKRMQER